jgi:hypothetical protein
VLNNTPALSFARVVKELSRFRPDFFLTATFWAFAVGIGFFFISYYFSMLYAKDLSTPSPEVEEFFVKMNTPVDVQKEVLAGGAKEVNIFRWWVPLLCFWLFWFWRFSFSRTLAAILASIWRWPDIWG